MAAIAQSGTGPIQASGVTIDGANHPPAIRAAISPACAASPQRPVR